MPVRASVRRFMGPPNYEEMSVAFRLLSRESSGVMVDVGAHHGSALSAFALAGWQVHAFEPDPRNRLVLVAGLGTMANVYVDARAVARQDGQSADLYTSDVSTGISTLTSFHSSHQVAARVKTVRLDTYLSQRRIGAVTLLKTDTEGHDLFALQTFPWDRQRPRVVVCEFENRKTCPLGYDFDDIATYLTSLGYTVLVSEWWPVVEYGGIHAWRSIRRYPSPLTDPNGWGNLIAVQPGLSKVALRLARRAGMQLRFRSTLTSLVR